MRSKRLGIKLLNYYVENDYLQEHLLEIDQKTENQEIRIVLSFIRFLVENYINSGPPDRLLTFSLDYIIPAYYLRRLKFEKRKIFASEFQFELRDSHRRLYTRLATIVTSSTNIHPGIIRINNRDGALEKILDVYNGSSFASWRKLYPNLERKDFPVARRDAVKNCMKYLKERDKENSECIWATSFLPTLFDGLEKKDRFALHPRQKARQDSKENENESMGTEDHNNNLRKPLPPEIVCSPALFSSFSGALPYLMFKTWTSKEGSNYLLNIWQVFALINRIIDDVNQSNSSNSKSDICRIVEKSLLRHLFGSDVVPPSQIQKTAIKHKEFEYFGIYKWNKFIDKIQTKDNPLSYYPWLKKENDKRDDKNITKLSLAWPQPHRPEWINGSMKEERCNESPYLDVIDVLDYNDLEMCKQLARSETLTWIAAAITEWLIIWKEELSPKFNDADETNCYRINYDDIKESINRFMKSREEENTSIGKNKGIGDIIQQWVLDLTNNILIQTIQIPKYELRSSTKNLRFITKADANYSSRDSNNRKFVHPLYQNISMLNKYNKKAEEELIRIIGSTIKISVDDATEKLYKAEVDHKLIEEVKNGANTDDVNSVIDRLNSLLSYKKGKMFSIVSSFPLIGLFLPQNDILAESSCLKSIEENFATLDTTASSSSNSERAAKWNICIDAMRKKKCDSIVCIGNLLLIPLDKKEVFYKTEKNTEVFLLDLAGLSWCGLDIRNSINRNEKKSNRPLEKIEERRTAMISMLNSMVADIETCDDAKNLIPYIILAIDGAISNMVRQAPKTNE
ncbi:hypothetical protein K8T06_01345 [bacterium]|nr:hypothetical protein [bacterium]